jgi:hypothetical protein
MLLLPFTPAVATQEPVRLEPMRIKEDPINSFGFQLKLMIDRNSRKIVRAVCGAVIEGSSAHRLGLQPNDEVVPINGRALAGMAAEIGPESELGRLIVAQHDGTVIDLEVISPRPRKLVVTAGRQDFESARCNRASGFKLSQPQGWAGPSAVAKALADRLSRPRSHLLAILPGRNPPLPARLWPGGR